MPVSPQQKYDKMATCFDFRPHEQARTAQRFENAFLRLLRTVDARHFSQGQDQGTADGQDRRHPKAAPSPDR